MSAQPIAPAGHSAPSQDARARIAPVDPAGFTTHGIAAIRHDFGAHPLMRLEALASLAGRLAATKQCRFIPPGTMPDSPFTHRPRHPEGRELDEVFRRMEEPGSWIALYNVETDAVYRGFLDEVTAAFRPLVQPEQGAILAVGGFIFVSAPPSVTPFHIDRENNFWLQVRGRKRMTVWDPRDRVAVAAKAVDQFILYGSLDEVRLTDESLPRGHAFDVGPGDGVYFPSTSPHMTRSDTDWAVPGDGVSISIGVVFYTEHTRRVARLRAWNALLRARGLSPREPGAGPVADALKSAMGAAYIGLKRRLRGYRPPPGF